MIQATLAAADYRAQTETGMQDNGGVRCTFTRDGDPASITAQLDSAGGVQIVYKATLDADPVLIFHGFMADLAACDQMAVSHADGTLTVE